jgi:tetratricopeptide (TPR) repeat protein
MIVVRWLQVVVVLAGAVAGVDVKSAHAAPAPRVVQEGKGGDAKGGDAKSGARPDAPDVKSDLKKADEARRAVKGEGAVRRKAMEEAAKAYEAVLVKYPDAKEEASTAAFRLGELRRLLGNFDGARDAFAKVVATGGNRRLSARAVLETAHLHRRSQELGKALEAYRKVVLEFPDETSTRDDALYWIGSLHQQSKDFGKAREAWQAVADRGVDPLDRVRAFDCVAMSYVKEGKRDEAAATIEKARVALHDMASDPSSRGARVKKALDRMRAVRAVEGKDAQVKGRGAAEGSGSEDDGDDEDDGD